MEKIDKKGKTTKRRRKIFRKEIRNERIQEWKEDRDVK